MATTDPVQTLLTVNEGDTVDIQAAYYDFSTPFEIQTVNEHSWVSPNGGIWRSRRVELASIENGGRSTEKTIDVVDGADAPDVGSYGPLVEADYVTDGAAETNTDGQNGDERPDWLERSAEEIVGLSSFNRSLGEVLDAVERQDSVLDVMTRLGQSKPTQARKLLWQLGLRDESGALLDDPKLSERLDELREVYCDD